MPIASCKMYSNYMEFTSLLRIWRRIYTNFQGSWLHMFSMRTSQDINPQTSKGIDALKYKQIWASKVVLDNL